jgi:hypothetical protein
MKSEMLAVLTVMAMASAAHGQEAVVACTQIKTATQLQAINANATTLTRTYCLMNDIDLGSIPNWTPIGDAPPYFSGTFYGNGHVVRNLKITASVAGYYGLFGAMTGGAIRDLGVVHVDIKVAATGSSVGGLFGIASPMVSPIFLSNVHSTGRVRCLASSCDAGGLIGDLSSNINVSRAWSSADVTAGGAGGGLVGALAGGGSSFDRIYATGNVTGTATSSEIGGLIGVLSGSPFTGNRVTRAFATGRVDGNTNAKTGGLIGRIGLGGFLAAAYATGPVSGGGSATVGGLVGLLDSGLVRQVFSTGLVTGAFTVGGLIGDVQNGPSFAAGYWDKTTSGMSTSATGTGKTTTQLLHALPTDFTLNWGISKGLSYPFLNDPDNFTSTLATLVSNDVVFTFLPIQQSDKSQYAGNPTHTAEASLATVYTMIARAVGVSDNVPTLKNVKVNKYFWHDATQTTTFSGPITTHATLGALKTLAPAAHLDGSNVVGQMNAHRLVILRGTFTKGGSTVIHYMLGSLYTKNGAAVKTIVANDPWTGTQVEVDPVTRKVVTPGFPLATFKVNGYRAVTTLN